MRTQLTKNQMVSANIILTLHYMAMLQQNGPNSHPWSGAPIDDLIEKSNECNCNKLKTDYSILVHVF